jgi:hypothetical protein
MSIEVADEELLQKKQDAGSDHNLKYGKQYKLNVREFLNFATLQGGNDN